EALSGFRQAENVYGTTAHHRITPNGYSGYFPPSWKRLSRDMEQLPDATTLTRLRSLGCATSSCAIGPRARCGGHCSIGHAPRRCGTSEPTAETCSTKFPREHAEWRPTPSSPTRQTATHPCHADR